MIVSEFSLILTISLNDSVSNTDLSDTVSIKLSEKQRAIAIQMSNCPSGNYDSIFGASGSDPLDGYTNGDATYGGDGSQLRLHFYDSAFKDVGLTGNSEDYDVLVAETCDTTLPVFTAAEIHYGLGYVRLFFSETVDITPEGLFDLSNIYIVDETGDRDEPDAVPLAGAIFNTTDDDQLILLTLTESRISALLIPEHQVTVLQANRRSITLMRDFRKFESCKYNAESNNVQIPDEVSPSIKSVIIDYNTGHIQIHLSEKILRHFGTWATCPSPQPV